MSTPIKLTDEQIARATRPDMMVLKGGIIDPSVVTTALDERIAGYAYWVFIEGTEVEVDRESYERVIARLRAA